MDKVFQLIVLLSLSFFTIEGRWISGPQFTSKFFGQTHRPLIGFGNHEQGNQKHFQRNFGTGTKINLFLLSEGRIIQSIDRIHDKVEIKLFNSFLSIGKTLISYEVQSYDYCNKLLLSVLAIPRLRFESELFKNFEAPFQPGQRSPIMDILIMNEIPESEIKRFDWILIKKLVFNGVDCGEYLIKNRRRDVNHLDSCLINELISSTTFGQHWNPEL